MLVIKTNFSGSTNRERSHLKILTILSRNKTLGAIGASLGMEIFLENKKSIWGQGTKTQGRWN